MDEAKEMPETLPPVEPTLTPEEARIDAAKRLIGAVNTISDKEIPTDGSQFQRYITYIVENIATIMGDEFLDHDIVLLENGDADFSNPQNQLGVAAHSLTALLYMMLNVNKGHPVKGSILGALGREIPEEAANDSPDTPKILLNS